MPKTLVHGDEIMRILKIPKGKAVGTILGQIRDLQLDKKIKTKKDALSYVQSLVKKSQKS